MKLTPALVVVLMVSGAARAQTSIRPTAADARRIARVDRYKLRKLPISVIQIGRLRGIEVCPVRGHRAEMNLSYQLRVGSRRVAVPNRAGRWLRRLGSRLFLDNKATKKVWINHQLQETYLRPLWRATQP